MDANSQTNRETPPPGDISRVVEHLFRGEAARMVATLTRIFGVAHLNLAEDVVQEALVRAVQTWPFYGIPKNPSAWIMRVSRNLALDVVRREKSFRDKTVEIVARMGRDGGHEEPVFPEHEIRDDRLRMMFVCCHPAVPEDAQAPLALKTLCGFGIGEISRAFLTTEAAIAKRLTRAKQKIREAGVAFEIPGGDELARRLDGVLQTLYLLFNEGHKASSGEKLVREELCREAIRLTLLLTEHPMGNQPKTQALLALMLLNTARLPARTDASGNLLRLREQDRTRWDQRMIARGLFHLAHSAAGGEISTYHLEAGIAACHCAAANYETTDWPQILALYDRLIERDESPVAALNRAVAVAKVHGPQAGLDALAGIRNRKEMSSYYLFYAMLGEFESQLNHREAAAGYFRKSLKLTGMESERVFLSRRLAECEEPAVAEMTGV